MNDLEKKINDARFDIFMRDPFLGYVLQHYEIFIDKNIETAYTNSKFIVIGEEFLNKLSKDETIFILIHEVLHIILGHVHRGRGLSPRKFNVACDIVVNDIIHSYLYTHGDLEPQFGISYHINGYLLSAEEVYNRLPDDFSEKTIDYHGIWTLISQSDLMKGNRELQRIIQVARNKGYVTSNINLTRKLKEMQYAKNKHRWAHILEKYITKELNDYSYQRTDYRYPNILLPSFMESVEGLKNIWFLVDVSGSMSEDLISMMLGEIDRIISHFKTISCDVSFFSNETTEPIRFTDSKKLMKIFKEAKTTGGTDFIQIFDSMTHYYKHNYPKLLIILTDGYASFPDKSKTKNIPVLWLTDNKEMKVPFGNIIMIE